MAGNPYQQMAIKAAQMYGLDPRIFTSQIQAESNWNPNALSSAGARGIAQFMPATAKGMGINPDNPQQALYGAAKMDAGNLKKYGSYQAMLSAYNSGNPNAWKDPNFAKGETANYVKKIMGGTNPFVASSGGVGPTDPSQNSRAALLGYLMQSNDANIQHKGSPSILPALMQMENGFASAPNTVPSNSSPNVPAGTKTDAYIEKYASPFGLKVTSTTSGGHAKNSYHYQGRAVDFGGSNDRMAALANQAIRTGGWTELIYTGPGNPGYSILNGKVIPNSQLPKSLYDEHTNHVHIAK